MKPDAYAPRRIATDVFRAFLQAPVVPVRADDDATRLARVLDACAAGGTRVFEFTDRLRASRETFAALRAHADERHPDLVLGVGSIRSPDDARAFVALGAEFVVTPFVDEAIADACRSATVPYVPGATTPTEVRRARASGAILVKLFPAGALGADYLTQLRGPDRDTRFMPTGGIAADADSVRRWAEAGASCLGFGSGLIGAGAENAGTAAALTQRCVTALEALRAARPAEAGTWP